MIEYKGLAVPNIIADLCRELFGIEPKRTTADYTTAPRVMTPAEQDVYDALRAAGIPPAAARRAAPVAVAAIRPVLYREAADYVRDVHTALTTAPMSDVVMGGIRSAAAVLEHRADELARRDEETQTDA